MTRVLLVVDAGAVGHLDTASGHGPWPLGERLLAQLLAETKASDDPPRPPSRQ